MKIREMLELLVRTSCPSASIQFGKPFLLAALVVLPLVVLPTPAQQITYPPPTFKGAVPVIPTSFTETVVVSNCTNPANDQSNSTSFNTSENWLLPLNIQANLTGDFVAVSLNPPPNIYTLVNGVSEGRGYSLAAGPVTEGFVTQQQTYGLSVAGATLSETFVDSQSLQETYESGANVRTITSTYNIITGVQVLTWDYEFNQVATYPAGTAGCDSTSTGSEKGSATYNFSGLICPANAPNVLPYPGLPKSRDGHFTAMEAIFSPSTGNTPMKLAQAAKACDVMSFDWQQTIENSPVQLTDATGAPVTPPTYDPPENSWLYLVQNSVKYAIFLPPQQTFPFYYNPNLVSEVTIPNGSGETLTFADWPSVNNMPAGGYLSFTTSLVGVLPFNAEKTFVTWTWQSTYSKATNIGGVSQPVIVQTASSIPVDGSGTGGITITSINGVAQTPPATTCAANPTTLWPPNGKSVPVSVTGTISAGTQTLTTSAYAVVDSYGQDQPNGSVTLNSDGSYSFQIPLTSARNGTDQAGRTYTIIVTGTDKIGNVGSCSAVVTVPHDQGQ
jgi:hypothetical protein